MIELLAAALLLIILAVGGIWLFAVSRQPRGRFGGYHRLLFLSVPGLVFILYVLAVVFKLLWSNG